MCVHLTSLTELTNVEDKVEKYAKEFTNLYRIQKRRLLEVIFEKLEVIDPYLIKIHIRNTANSNKIGSSVEKSCDYGLSGGTNRT